MKKRKNFYSVDTLIPMFAPKHQKVVPIWSTLYLLNFGGILNASSI